MFEYTPLVLSTWVSSSFKNAKIIYILVLLQFLSIWVENINSVTRLIYVFNAGGNMTNLTKLKADDFSFSKLNVLNPLSYLQDVALAGFTDISKCTPTSCAFGNSMVLALGLIIVILLFCHHYSCYLGYKWLQKSDIAHASDGRTSKLSAFLNVILINVIDLTFKIFSIFLFYIFFNKIFVGLYFSTDYVYVALSAIFIIIFVFCYVYQVNYVVLFMRVDHRDSLHYDTFSQNYDLLLLILKIIQTFNKNLLLINLNDEYTKHVLFLDYCIIFCIYTYAMKSVLSILGTKNLIIVSNLRLNLLRLCLTFYICVYLIILAFFEFFSVYNIVMTNVIVILITAVIMTYLNLKISSLISTDSKVLYQLIYLLDIFLSKEMENSEFDIESLKIKHLHDFICASKDKYNAGDLNGKITKTVCEICQYNISNHDHAHQDSAVHKMKIMKVMIDYINKHVLHSLSEEEVEIFNFVDLIFNYALTQIDHSIPHFMVIYKNMSLLHKFKMKKNSFYFNLEFYYLKINRQSENNLKKFRVIKRYDSSLLSLKRSVEIIREVVATIESKVKKDLYPLTCELYSHRMKIIENLSDIYAQTNVYKDIFSFVLCRFVFENAFNNDLSDSVKNLMTSDDFDSKVDLIDDHFNKDSILIINYKVSENSLLITRASKKFVNFQGKYLEEIFPIKFRALGRQKFIEAIQSNNDHFAFEFLVETHEEFVKNLKLDCKIHRSFDLEEIFIFANYKLSNEDLIVFETPCYIDMETHKKLYDMQRSMLISFSQYLEKVLFITPKLLNFFSTLSVKKKHLSFTDVFSPRTEDFRRKKLRAHNDEDGREFNLEYMSLYKNFYEDIDRLVESMENEDIKERMAEIRGVVKNKETLSVLIKEMYMMNKNENYAIFVYNMKVQMKRMKNHNVGGGERYYNFLNTVVRSKQFVNNLLEHARKFGKGGKSKNGGFNFIDGLVEAKSIDEDDLMDMELMDFKSQSSQQQFQSRGTAITALKSNNISSILPGKKGDAFTSGNSMAHYTIITLLINICLIVYCVVFMIVGFGNNSKMNELNQILAYFHSFERLFYQTSLSLFYNVGVYEQNIVDSKLYSNSYWDKFSSGGFTISMGDYANKELNVKGGLLNLKMSDMLDYFYSSSYKETINDIVSFNTEQKSITLVGSDMQLAMQKTPFLESVLHFIHYAKSVSFPSMSTMIYIFNYDLMTNNYDFSSIKNKTFSDVQLAVYESIFNFPNFLNNMNKIDIQINNLFDSEVSSIFSLNLYLSLVLIVLHVFLLIIALSIINFLKSLTADSNFIFSKLITGDWSKYLDTKSRILKDMLKFYKRDPLKCSNKIRKDQSDAARVAREHQREQSKNKSPDQEVLIELEHTPLDAEVGIDALMAPLMRVLVILFSFYLIYACGFILLFQDSQKNIQSSSDYANTYLKVDKGVMTVVMLLQSILFSNQTDYNLLKYLTANSNFTYDQENKLGYIDDLLEQVKIYNSHLAKLEHNNPKFEVVQTEANLYSDCDYLYNHITSDDVLALTKNMYETGQLTTNLIKLCKFYPVMNQRNFKNIIEEINYVAKKLIKRYEFTNGQYAKMKDLNDDTEFFDSFTVNLMIFRPLQTYLISNQIDILVANSQSYFLTCVISFMMGNILVECIIFFVINRKLIARVLVINEEIRCLTICITA